MTMKAAHHEAKPSLAFGDGLAVQLDSVAAVDMSCCLLGTCFPVGVCGS